MKKARNLLATMIITLFLFSVQVYAMTPDRSLNNPLFLSEMGNVKLIYGAYDATNEKFLVSYAEYDEYAKGHGAFILQANREDDAKVFSFIGTKELGNIGLGLAVHRVTSPSSEWLLDLGVSYGRRVVGRIGIHDVPIASWDEIKERSNFSIGGTVYLTESLAVGVDARLLDQQYDGLLRLVLSQDLTATLNLMYKDLQWESVGANVWLNRNNLVIHLGYTLEHNWESSFRFGLGFRF